MRNETGYFQFGMASFVHAVIVCGVFALGARKAESHVSFFIFATIPLYCAIVAWKARHNALTLVILLSFSAGLAAVGAALWALDWALWSDFRLDSG